jgi:hypothetical protein
LGNSQSESDRRMPGATNPDDNLKTPLKEGEPPRPATEPDHAEGSSNGAETLTDPATGRPNPR